MSSKNDSETCLSLHIETLDQNQTIAVTLCPPVWDGFICWDRATAGEIASHLCPTVKGSDAAHNAFRLCGSDGRWLDRDGLSSDYGWTNYTPCFTPEIREVMRRLGSQDEAQTKLNIAVNTRILELVGLSLSLTALVLSLLIFHKFRTLRNSRTRLHRHLFVAMVIQVAIRLTLYIDQAITRASYPSNNMEPLSQENLRGIDNTPILCEAGYICLEYARTAMFMWMFVEGLYLHNMITVNVFEERLSPLIYFIVGWIIPIPLTFTWAFVTAMYYGTATCWWGYNFTLYFWILEGPRLAVLMVNLAFLLNILRVLVTKLRRSNSSETDQARKAVKAALLLLPLLGLTNLVNMLDAPLEKSAWIFGLWSYSTHILTSCQGLILACLYCFCNGEVQLALKKYVRTKILGRNIVRLPTPSVRMSLLNNSTIHNRDSKAGNSIHPNNTVRVVMKKTNETQHPVKRLETNHLKRNNNNRQDNGNSVPVSISFPSLKDDKGNSTDENFASSQRVGKFSRLQRLFVPTERVDNSSGTKHKRSRSEILVLHEVDSNESTGHECGEILDDSNSNEEYIDACPV